MMMTGRQMRELRERRAMTQEELAAELGLSRETVVAYEKGSKRGQPFAIPRNVALACRAIAKGFDNFDPPDLQLDIYRLCTRRGPRPDVLQWCVENLERAVVIYDGFIKFAVVNDLVHFKMRWGEELGSAPSETNDG
jgi:DNA-binding XRE family transcriptional regulator